MINITNSNDSYNFQIGKHFFNIEKNIIDEWSTLINNDWVEKVAAGEISWKNNDWKIEEAFDDNAEGSTKYESRDRILLWKDSKKWHLTQSEVLKIGVLCRSI